MRCASISATAQANACWRMRGEAASGVRAPLLGIIQPNDSPLGIENDRGGYYRTKQRAAAGFVQAGDARPTELTRGSFETGRAKSRHFR